MVIGRRRGRTVELLSPAVSSERAAVKPECTDLPSTSPDAAHRGRTEIGPEKSRRVENLLARGADRWPRSRSIRQRSLEIHPGESRWGRQLRWNRLRGWNLSASPVHSPKPKRVALRLEVDRPVEDFPEKLPTLGDSPGQQRLQFAIFASTFRSMTCRSTVRARMDSAATISRSNTSRSVWRSRRFATMGAIASPSSIDAVRRAILRSMARSSFVSVSTLMATDVGLRASNTRPVGRAQSQGATRPGRAWPAVPHQQ